MKFQVRGVLATIVMIGIAGSVQAGSVSWLAAKVNAPTTIQDSRLQGDAAMTYRFWQNVGELVRGRRLAATKNLSGSGPTWNIEGSWEIHRAQRDECLRVAYLLDSVEIPVGVNENAVVITRRISEYLRLEARWHGWMGSWGGEFERTFTGIETFDIFGRAKLERSRRAEVTEGYTRLREDIDRTRAVLQREYRISFSELVLVPAVLDLGQTLTNLEESE